MNSLLKLMIFSIMLVAVLRVCFSNFEEFIQVIEQWPLGSSLTFYAYKFRSSFLNVAKPVVEKRKGSKLGKLKLLTPEMLQLYDGQKGSKGLYIGILGRVYDVKKGKAHYGPGQGYHFFAGKDGSRAFVSGDFTDEGLTDDVTGLSKQDYLGLNEWISFYEKDYKFVGKVVGRFYDKDGQPTEYNLQVQKWTDEARLRKADEDKDRALFPPCNSEWNKAAGSKLWCTKKSGGIDRDWVGVPRKLYAVGKQAARCACIKNTGPPSHDLESKTDRNNGDLDHAKLEEYEGCDPTASSCQLAPS